MSPNREMRNLLYLPDDMWTEIQHSFARRSYRFLLAEIVRRYRAWMLIREFAKKLPTDLQIELIKILDTEGIDIIHDLNAIIEEEKAERARTLESLTSNG